VPYNYIGARGTGLSQWQGFTGINALIHMLVGDSPVKCLIVSKLTACKTLKNEWGKIRL
jgi:hypothetical protein